MMKEPGAPAETALLLLLHVDHVSAPHARVEAKVYNIGAVIR